MMKRGHASIRLIQFYVLIAGLTPGWACADDRRPQKPFRLNATATIGPIGAVYSTGAMAINNRRVQGQQVIWDGDLIEMLAGTNANVLLDQVGQVTLANGASVRLTTKLAESDEDYPRPTLVVSLFKGEMVARLTQETGAYIEAGGAVYTASSGASFRIEIREGRAVIHEASGAVTLTPRQGPVQVIARGVRGRPTNSAGHEQLDTKIRMLEVLIHQSEKRYRRSAIRRVSYTPGATPIHAEQIQTDQVTEPLANRLVHYNIQPPDMGDILDPVSGQPTTTALTNADGVARVIFRAGDHEARGQVVARIELTPEELANTNSVPPPGEYTWDVSITKPGFFQRNRYKILIAAGGVSIGCILWCSPGTSDGNKPLQQVPPPVIKP